MQSGAGLFCQAVHAGSLPYKISFLLPQTDSNKPPTLLYQEPHSLLTNIPCFSHKQNALFENAVTEKGFKSIQMKDFLQIVH